MNIYLVRKNGKTGLDQYDGFVVTAESEGGARELCMNCDSFNSNTWFNPRKSTCELIGTSADKQSEIILSSFNAA